MDLDQLARALNAFAAYDPTGFPVHYAQLFLYVARKGHCAFAELEEELNVTNGGISRAVAAMSETRANGRPGYRLLEVYKDPEQPRRYQVRLSPFGRALYKQLRDS